MNANRVGAEDRDRASAWAAPGKSLKIRRLHGLRRLRLADYPISVLKGTLSRIRRLNFLTHRRSKPKELRALHEHPVCFAHGSDPPQIVICVICVICGYSTSVIRGACSSASIRVHLRLWLDQRFAEHFVDGAYGTKLKTLFRFRGHFFEVFFVGFREEHEVDTGA
jgi:hypothetical protein